MDLSHFDDNAQRREGPRLARRLGLLLDRLHPADFGRLSNQPAGTPERGVAEDEEVITAINTNSVSAELRLVRRRRSEHSAVWVVASGTVEEIDSLYSQLGYGWAGDHLPSWMFSVRLWQVQLWQWLGLALGLVVALAFGYLFGFLSRRIFLRLALLTRWQWDDRVVAATKGPVNVICFSLGLLLVGSSLSLGNSAEQVVRQICKLLIIVGLGWFAVRLVDVAADSLQDYLERRGDSMATAFVPVARRIFKPIAIALVMIVALQNLGVNVAGLLAGVGIGGLALAMAAKTTVENMLGGITIAFDRPFQVDDFIRVGDLLGTVEEVGIRSTRIRTLDRTVVSIPNGQLVDSHVENFAKRDRIRLAFNIGVQYDTTLDQLRLIVDEMKRALLTHPKVHQEYFRVRFVAFADSALEIEAYLYIDTTDYNEFTAAKEELLLQVATIVNRAGAQFAFPTRAIYTGKVSETDNKKAKQASKLIAERSQIGELSIPEIPESLRERLLAPAQPADG